ncbi:OmpA family protein [Hippea jasoniae]|uniref:OmpA family protein n=1 Tax=Hippea jasoniae TaxID=944479 RepID=UPI00068960CB|nr:OmpA family protein [Hippea jasoniae]
MRKLFLSMIIVLLFGYSALADGLQTGSSKPFIPADKVVFVDDFSDCPIGEPPSKFDKVSGAGECVKYRNMMWLAPSTDGDYRVYKKIDLGRDEFSIEFDFLGYQDPGGADFLFRFLQSKGNSWDQARLPYDLQIHDDYNGYTFWLEKVGKIGRLEKFHKKKVHIAIQVRRHQLRIYANGKRLTVVPFSVSQNEHVSGVGFMFYDDTRKYGELLTNIRIAKYSKKEKRPQPEKLGIKMEKTSEGTKLTIPEKVLFDFNQFFLKLKAKDALHVVAEILKQQPDKRVLIIGYTDNVGSDAYNLKLSLQRAQSVADYLIYVEGINKGRIKIEGKGKADPIANNNTEEGRAKNRRVEIKIY